MDIFVHILSSRSIMSFEERIKNHKESVKTLSKTYNLIGFIRLVVFLCAGFFTYVVWNLGFNLVYSLACVMSYSAFIVLIIYHRKIHDKLEYDKGMIRINEKFVSRMNGKWVDFKDIGEEFIDKEHPYSSDLDIVGQKSLFQLINSTNTFIGRETLAQNLLNANFDKEEIKLRQEAIKELSGKLNFCQSIENCSYNNRNKLQNPEFLFEYGNEGNEIIKSKVLKSILYILPMITMPLALAFIIFKGDLGLKLAFLIMALQLLIWTIGLNKINLSFNDIAKFKNGFDGYYNLLLLIEKEDFKSEKLKNLKNELFKEKDEALKAMKDLNKVMNKINTRFNTFLMIPLNAMLLWDYQCVFSLENWRNEYGSKVENWLKLIGQLEVFISFSNLHHINDNVSYCSIDNTILNVKATALGHPLINSNIRICNDLNMNNEIFVITGSNMSGKTTFLRTIGINLVLAYNGAPVCAKSMVASKMDIFTSMRISDDLKNGISTFYAELVRIKKIIDASNQNSKMIFLIDEIFRGTNSVDRITGAKNVLANLEKLGTIGLITTHDLELCALENNKRIKNYHFSEHYKENKIVFDYKFKYGRSTSTNAKYLMNMVGIKILEE